jgi:hypothetical protein
MRSNTLLILLIIVGILTLLLMLVVDTSPATQESRNKNINFFIKPFKTDDGLDCIGYWSGNQFGMSCNWEKYNEILKKCQQDHESEYPDFPDIEGRCKTLVIGESK